MIESQPPWQHTLNYISGVSVWKKKKNIYETVILKMPNIKYIPCPGISSSEDFVSVDSGVKITKTHQTHHCKASLTITGHLHIALNYVRKPDNWSVWLQTFETYIIHDMHNFWQLFNSVKEKNLYDFGFYF